MHPGLWRGGLSPCVLAGWAPGGLSWRPGARVASTSSLAATCPVLWVSWFGFFNASSRYISAFWKRGSSYHLYSYIYLYILSTKCLFARCLTVSSGPARLVTICPRSSSPPPDLSGVGAGHQLYVLKMTVSNKCLLIFFQGFHEAEFVGERGVGPFPRTTPARAGCCRAARPARTAARPCGTCSPPGAPAGGAPNHSSRRPARPGPQLPAARRAASELHGGAPGLRHSPLAAAAAAPRGRRRAGPAGGEERHRVRGPVGAAALPFAGRGPRAPGPRRAGLHRGAQPPRVPGAWARTPLGREREARAPSRAAERAGPAPQGRPRLLPRVHGPRAPVLRVCPPDAARWAVGPGIRADSLAPPRPAPSSPRGRGP